MTNHDDARELSPLHLSPHAAEQARARGISQEHIETVLAFPDVVQEGRKKRTEFVGRAEGRKLTVVRSYEGVIVTVFWD